MDKKKMVEEIAILLNESNDVELIHLIYTLLTKSR